MLDERGIYLNEVNRRYPRTYQVLGYDVLMDTDVAYKPKVISSFEMLVNSIITILLMKPGQYPSIPELGIDIESYLYEYADDKNIPNAIESKLRDQLNRIDISGCDVRIDIERMSDGTYALIVRITVPMYMATGYPSNRAIVGITYSKLNEVYIRKIFEERSIQS